MLKDYARNIRNRNRNCKIRMEWMGQNGKLEIFLEYRK